VVADTPEAVAANWEVLKKAEKGRQSITEGIPSALPALALAGKLQGKAASVGLEPPPFDERRAWLLAAIGELVPATGAGGEGGPAEQVGEVLFALVDLARRLGVDAEEALRRSALAFRDRITAEEHRAAP
jgi:uncharacterized protein YabN with tetrapyrrole methylase and pyrophosphatase domain